MRARTWIAVGATAVALAGGGAAAANAGTIDPNLGILEGDGYALALSISSPDDARKSAESNLRHFILSHCKANGYSGFGTRSTEFEDLGIVPAEPDGFTFPQYKAMVRIDAFCV